LSFLLASKFSSFHMPYCTLKFSKRVVSFAGVGPVLTHQKKVIDEINKIGNKDV